MTTEKFDLVLRFDDEVSRALFFEWFWHHHGAEDFDLWVTTEEGLSIVPGGIKGKPDAEVQVMPMATEEVDFGY